ncbi:MAG: ATP-dependent RNA helicase RhlE [Gemmatimonadetes bacterium]|nr:MAG: ATP-dependent RNA helicase RhlE [Gemmatimonadota bacterium]PYO84229.1 MAG: ATP-dependent RNA helicase RhlE [Gemmatimonadota bacterium]PYP63992.1 MAG: ATP-dependent RNA helicase RhlE [Gemmatimonadota bacterium]
MGVCVRKLVMSFAALGLVPELLRAVAEEGYERPTPIQQETIPLALEGRDLIGSAQTGTGKTAAFMLPILQRLAPDPRHTLRALILVPTRELAEQVLQSALAYGRHTRLSAAAVYGGVGLEPQTQALRRGVDIVVATPGRLLDHMERGHVDYSRLEVLVLDEADRMLDMGFAPDVRRILRELPVERQTLLFSATISPEVDALARTALNGHASVEIGRRAQAADGIEHVIVAVDKLQKRDALAKILQAKPAGQTLVFTRTKYGADKLAGYLKKEGIPAHALHGDKAQSHRTRTLEAFRRGVSEILVATDIAARGIDVDGIRMVVNFDVPADAEIYVHRVGRTARAGARGLALTLLSPDEWLLMADIEKLIGQTFPREVIPGFEPSVAPLQPRTAEPAVPRRSVTVRGRTGAARRRR